MNEFSLLLLFVLLPAFLGFRMKALTIGGAFCAVITGLTIGISFDFFGLILLGTFFFSSSILSQLNHSENEIVQKGHKRDWIQVFSNGGTASILSVLNILFPNMHESWEVAFVASLAIANADTWASELGSLSKKRPIHVRTLKRVSKGTSGAVSMFGTVMGIAGAMLIAVTCYIIQFVNVNEMMIITLIGVIGLFLDTWMGATIQTVYRCVACGLETERSFHCKGKTVHIKGIPFVNNDVVNFASISIPSVSYIFINFFLVG